MTISVLVLILAKPFDNKPSHSMCCHLANGPLELEQKFFLSNNVRISTATEISEMCTAICTIIIVTIAHIAATFAVVRTMYNVHGK